MSSTLQVLYEDNHLLVVNKQSGDLVQGDRTGDEPLVDRCKTYIKRKYDKPGDVFLGVIHRLDRPVSGVVAFARTSKALERMNKLFRDKSIQKTYWAVSRSAPVQVEDKLIHWLKKDSKSNTTKAFIKAKGDALRSELDYRILSKEKSMTLIEVHPITGRPHQIRVQLASLGCPIIGDIKYGDKSPNKDKSIHLHAVALDFIHPVKKESLKIIAPLPADTIWDRFTTFLPEY